MLERAGLGVGQEACVQLPADFFWVVHEPLKTRRLLPHFTWRTEVRRYECQVNGKPTSTAARSQKAGPAATKSTEPAGRRRYQGQRRPSRIGGMAATTSKARLPN